MRRLFLVFVMWAIPLSAQTQWDRVKGNCEQKFMNYQQVKLDDLTLCMKFWEAYRDISKLKPQQRQFMAAVFERVFVEASRDDSYLAKVAMTRLGFPPGPDSLKKREEFKHRKKRHKKRRRYIPLPASKAAQKKAKRIRAKAMHYYKRKRYARAIEYLDRALKLYPGYVQALYDEACTRALMGDKDNAIEYLMRLRDLKSREGYKKLRLARKDKDFASIREDPQFKMVTGYAHLKLLNGMSVENRDIGDDNISVLKDVLAKIGYPPEVIDVDKHVRTRPIIWYKNPSKAVALVLKQIFNNPHVLLVPIDWNSKFDIIISWADKVTTTSDGDRQVKHSLVGNKSFDPDKKANSILNEEDKMLSGPDKYVRKTAHAVNTPTRVMNKGKAAVDRVKDTGKAINRVMKKLSNPF